MFNEIKEKFSQSVELEICQKKNYIMHGNGLKKEDLII